MIVSSLKPVRLALLCCLVFLAGCKEVLYSKLTQRDANQIVAVLHERGISASRTQNKDGDYEILVESARVASAIQILMSEGLPKQRFQSLGEVFTDEGVLGTPFQEHIRFVHAMNQELSRTISEIAGIRHARVLMTSPEKKKFEKKAAPAHASVAIHHEPSLDPKGLVSKVKLMVSHSVPNLEYEDVVVVLFPLESTGPSLKLNTSEDPNSVSNAAIIPLSGNFENPFTLFLTSVIVLSIGFVLLYELLARRRRKAVARNELSESFAARLNVTGRNDD